MAEFLKGKDGVPMTADAHIKLVLGPALGWENENFAAGLRVGGGMDAGAEGRNDAFLEDLVSTDITAEYEYSRIPWSDNLKYAEDRYSVDVRLGHIYVGITFRDQSLDVFRSEYDRFTRYKIRSTGSGSGFETSSAKGWAIGLMAAVLLPACGPGTRTDGRNPICRKIPLTLIPMAISRNGCVSRVTREP